jgi:gamma-tubulin complex component 3
MCIILTLVAVESLFMADRDSDLQSMMDTAYLETSRRVLDVLIGQYKFLDHLQALRRYLLLGQGDFIHHLMELLELVFVVRCKYLIFCAASEQIHNC